jgi:electron transfer flavoprotein beta subunit
MCLVFLPQTYLCYGRVVSEREEAALNTIVCIKRVPQTADAEVRVSSSGKDIDTERLTFDINEADTYALEEAVLLKERLGGSVTVITLGGPDSEDILRMAAAKGADTVIRVKAEDFGELDAFKTAQILSTAIKNIEFDLIMSGCMATDDAYYQVGVTLAQLLDIPHSTLLAKIEPNEGKADVHRELEGGLLQHLQITLPALFTIQTGINVPRYASLIAIRRAAKKEIQTLGKDDLGGENLLLNAQIEELFTPPVTKRAEILTGSPEEASGRLADLLKEKGFV